MAFVSALKCRECGREYPIEPSYTCSWCFGPLEVAYDYDGIRAAVTRDSIELVVQVNGKLRARLEAPASADKAAIEKLAMESDNVQRHLEGKTVRKVIVVPGKLVNVVV